MPDPVISPDGKWMWTCSEWIPAPPAAEPASVSMQDSVIAGDVNITQNNAEDIAAAMVTALERLRFSGQSSPSELTSSQEAEVEQVLEMSEQLASHGIEIDPWTEIALGNLAKHASSRSSHLISRDYYLSALEKFQGQQIWSGELVAYIGLAELHYRSSQDLRELEQIYHWIVRISEENGERSTLSAHLFKLGLLAEYENDPEKAKQYYEKVLIIDREIGNHIETTLSLSRLGKIAEWGGDLDSAERLFGEVLSIFKDHGERKDEVSPLTNLAFISFSRGHFYEAGQLFGNAQDIINSEKENKSDWYFTGDIN